MKRLLWGIPGSGKIPYFRKVLRTRPGNLIGYWPMWESSGSDALDLSPQGNNGAYTAVTLGETGIGDGRTCPSFDGSTSFNNIYSAALGSDFDSSAGTLMGWAKVSGSGVWTDDTSRFIARLAADANNQVALLKWGTDNKIYCDYTAAATVTQVGITLTTTDWFHVALTYDAAEDEVKAYLNGAQTGDTLTGLGSWSGALNSATAVIGAQTTDPLYVWSGDLAHPALWNVALTASEIANLVRV